MFTIDQNLCVNCGRCAAACPMGIFRVGEGGTVEVGAQKRCIRCFHCSAACPTKAVNCASRSGEALYPRWEGSALENLVAGRRSVRRFQESPPSRALLQRAFDAAAYAPSAKNRRICRWSVLYGKDRTDAAAALALKWAVEHRVDPALTAMARSGKNLVTCGAPCVVVCHAPAEAAAMLDGAIAMTTLELLLCEAGLGTCWAGYFARLAQAAPPLRAYLALPEGDEVLCALMVGNRDEGGYPNLPPRESAQLNWID